MKHSLSEVYCDAELAKANGTFFFYIGSLWAFLTGAVLNTFVYVLFDGQEQFAAVVAGPLADVLQVKSFLMLCSRQRQSSWGSTMN